VQALSLSRLAVVCVAATASVLTLAIPAHATFKTHRGAGGASDNNNISADADYYEVQYVPKQPPPGHALAPVTNWTPPPCWMAPSATPKQLKAEREHTWGLESTGYQWDEQQEDYYVKGHPHKNFEIANTGKGMWWNGHANPAMIADPHSLDCFKELDDWVPNGTKPPAGPGPVVTPEILAESAYNRIHILPRPIEMSPPADGTQTVNLNTWAWLTAADIKPVTVTASLASLGIWATTTAKPVGLHINAGTSDATLYPASGDCPMNADGSIGKPYAAADGNAVPPCGLTYRRSTDGATFPLSATIRWAVSWKGSDGTGGDLPGGSVVFTQNVVVQDIQSVNR
jgi:enoyl reductase